jgi:hypothetical protein
MRGGFVGEPAFADARLACDREQAPTTGYRAVDSSTDFGQFPPATDEGLSTANRVCVAHSKWVQAASNNRPNLTNFTKKR